MKTAETQAAEVVPVFAGHTYRGRTHSPNEDQYLIGDLRHTMVVRDSSLNLQEGESVHGENYACLLVVADGISGEPAGDRASQIALHAATQYVLHFMPWFTAVHGGEDNDAVASTLSAALTACQDVIQTDVERHPENCGMGASLTMAYIVWPSVHVVHVGNTAAFLQRNGILWHLSHEQSVARQLHQKGVLTVDEMTRSRWRRVLHHPLGGYNGEVSPDVMEVTLRRDDRILLCTDGLTESLSEEEISAILRQPGLDCEDRVEALSKEALAAAPDDDFTAVVCEFSACEEYEEEPELMTPMETTGYT